MPEAFQQWITSMVSGLKPYGDELVLLLLFLAGVNLLLALVSAAKLGRLSRRVKAQAGGKQGSLIAARAKDQGESRVDPETLEKIEGTISLLAQQLDSLGQQALTRVGVVRFNAFHDVGSDLSFALALLNQRGDGVVISSLYGREECRSYAKPVQGGVSSYNLSQEEKEAIRQAMSR
jgi:hypothetical protein